MENALVALSDGLAAAVEQAGRTVVAVHGRPRVSSSGVLWRNGVVVTADHTLRREDSVRVTLPDGKTVPAEIAGRDSGTDLAVLKIEAADVPSLNAQAPPDLKIGNLTLVVGRSAETGASATLGVISSLSGPWNTWRGGQIDQFVRLDAGVYPGLSGGAVVDARGRFIGIATLGLSRTSPLAVPSATIERVAAQLLEKGHIARGFLGVGLQPVALPQHLKDSLRIAGKTGLIVLSVEPEAPAGQAGVGIGDVFVALDGKPVGDTEDVQAVLTAEYVGKTVQASILRGGALIELPIIVGVRPRRRA
jgi:S1-C subfamily serine protease